MIVKTINIPIYSYRLIYVEIESEEDLLPIIRLSKRLHLGDENIKEIESRITNKEIGGATTFHKYSNCTLVVILYPQPDEKRKKECIAHEKRHCEDFILERLNIEDKEAAAYLSGWLATQLP